MILYYAGIAFTIAMAVTCVRRGQTSPWIWIILIFPPIGGAVYFFTEVFDAKWLRRMGGARASSRELKVAEAEVRRLDNTDAWTTYAQALRSRKQFDQALAAATSAVEKDDSNWRALNELGLAQMGLADYVNAAATLTKVVELQPNHADGDAAFALAVSLEKSGQKDEARRVLEQLARTTSLPKVLFSLASLQADAGQTQRRPRVPTKNHHRSRIRPLVPQARSATVGPKSQARPDLTPDVKPAPKATKAPPRPKARSTETVLSTAPPSNPLCVQPCALCALWFKRATVAQPWPR